MVCYIAHSDLCATLEPCCERVREPTFVRSQLRELELHLYWFTPLAKKPPSTTRTCPVTNEAASEAR